VLALFAGPALAQTFPDRPVRVIVPFPPGGLVDTFARTLQPEVARALEQQAIIENRGGAGATIGEALVARAAPDAPLNGANQSESSGKMPGAMSHMFDSRN
jgi:tripartite-type tricarboxylate transporter receptor subunit TctC